MNIAPPNYNFNASELVSKIEIKVSCENLPNFDTLTKSDPKVFIFQEKVTYANNTKNTYWENIDSTERIKNSDNPVFTKSIYMDYYFEMIQNLRFVVFDMDSDSNEWSKNDFIGYAEKTVGDLISGSQNNVYQCDLLTTIPSGINCSNTKAKFSSKQAKINIRIQEVVNSPYEFTMDIIGSDLDKKDTFGKSDPFIIISRIENDSSLVKIFETPVIKNTLNPKWKNIRIPEISLNNGDPDKLLLWEVYDYDKNSSNDLIGIFKATTRVLFEQNTFELINEKKKAKKGSKYKNSGVIKFENLTRVRKYSFIDFPMNGTEVAVSFAIDFTASNGDPNNSNSLHYRTPNYDMNNFYTLNEYQKAISSIGYVLEPYDTTRYMEVYGYGGMFFNRNEVEFDCSLTGDPNNPSVLGVAGILNAYFHALQTTKLYGPTNFSPIIKKISEEAKRDLLPPGQNNPLPRYYILTIITDGAISDMEKTIASIINANELPLSIIIIGVGNADFTNMKKLDGDNKVLKLNNKYSTRDIVQFVPLADYINDPGLLAQETLKEIPKHPLQGVGILR
jgi:hypothetical protein